MNFLGKAHVYINIALFFFMQVLQKSRKRYLPIPEKEIYHFEIRIMVMSVDGQKYTYGINFAFLTTAGYFLIQNGHFV